MNRREATALLGPAIPRGKGVWVDLGAGGGTFTRVLAETLEAGSRIFAVDRDPRAIGSLRAIFGTSNEVVPVLGDIRDLDSIPELAGVELDGALLANALHFLPEPAQVLRAVSSRLHPDGRIVVIEYDRRPASRWVPYPVSLERLHGLARDLGFESPQIVNEKPSAYSGVLYCAVLRPRGLGRAAGHGRVRNPRL